MSVQNVRVEFIRPKYKNLKMWMSDTNNVYIGRGGVVFVDKERFPRQDSMFANPYKIGKDGTRQDVLNKYKQYIEEKINSDKNYLDNLLLLEGKKLGCWCHPEPCHGDILLDFIKKLKK